ncbi:glutathione S-transferase family protein [Ideonella sp.]|uniref:glutathione S-transferase family protein n=1 Tax=Ideonella sp. TaxID=1929293 RepID=UPI0035AE47D2
MIQLLGQPSSINVRKVRWLLHELALPHLQVPYGAGHQPTDTAEFRALNPNGLVPVLRDGELVLWESNTICRYLASREQRDDLLPRAPAPRARIEQWMDWQATELNTAWRYAFMALVRHSPAHTDRTAVRDSVQAWNRHMQIIDAQLDKTGHFMAGPDFTLADIVIGLSVNRWLMTPMAHAELPAVAAYVERLGQRTGYRLHGGNGTP